jgi:hypothetical protein
VSSAEAAVTVTEVFSSCSLSLQASALCKAGSHGVYGLSFTRQQAKAGGPMPQHMNGSIVYRGWGYVSSKHIDATCNDHCCF